MRPSLREFTTFAVDLSETDLCIAYQEDREGWKAWNYKARGQCKVPLITDMNLEKRPYSALTGHLQRLYLKQRREDVKAQSGMNVERIPLKDRPDKDRDDSFHSLEGSELSMVSQSSDNANSCNDQMMTSLTGSESGLEDILEDAMVSRQTILGQMNTTGSENPNVDINLTTDISEKVLSPVLNVNKNVNSVIDSGAKSDMEGIKDVVVDIVGNDQPPSKGDVEVVKGGQEETSAVVESVVVDNVVVRGSNESQGVGTQCVEIKKRHQDIKKASQRTQARYRLWAGKIRDFNCRV